MPTPMSRKRRYGLERSSKDEKEMNWQVVTFFGDSTVLLPSAAVLFIVLFLRKDSKQLAWHWALLFGITGAIVCASKLAFMGWTSLALAGTPHSLPLSGQSSYGCCARVPHQLFVLLPSYSDMHWPGW